MLLIGKGRSVPVCIVGASLRIGSMLMTYMSWLRALTISLCLCGRMITLRMGTRGRLVRSVD